MSTKVNIKTEIRDSKILKDTLKQLNINYKESDSLISISAAYHNTSFNLLDGTVSYDDMNKEKVNQICRNYQKNLVVSNANLNNHIVESITENQNNEIIIELSY